MIYKIGFTIITFLFVIGTFKFIDTMIYNFKNKKK